jgi:ATP-independent RNA helicase DbpA
MQLQALQTIPQNNDVVLLAPTGSGKTLGFLLPVLQLIDRQKQGVQVLILSPSRELALQIEQVFKSMSTGYKVNCCYGGHNARTEQNNLSHPPTVLIGTPGRIADHLRNQRIDTRSITTLVFDEYDKCLEFGFKEEIAQIVGFMTNVKNRILISATESRDDYAFSGITNPVTIAFESQSETANLQVKAVATVENNRIETLFRLICLIGNQQTLVFCNVRETVERISDMLWQKGLPNTIFHGGLDQDLRERTLITFRNGSHQVLVTTDLAARGLDIPDIQNIIHFNLPASESIFTHRNGRTARMHASYIELPERTVLPAKSEWDTLYISAGKKEKISKGDVAGLLMQKGKLQKDELGLIEILDHSAYVAVKRSKIAALVQLIKNEPIKKQKVKIAIMKPV